MELCNQITLRPERSRPHSTAARPSPNAPPRSELTGPCAGTTRFHTPTRIFVGACGMVHNSPLRVYVPAEASVGAPKGVLGSHETKKKADLAR